MKRSRNRMMSVLLAFSIVFGSVGYAFAHEYNVVETNDPFADMVSLIEEVDASQLLAEESVVDIDALPPLQAEVDETAVLEKVETEKSYMQRVQEQREKLSKTDRYIVKYKSDSGKAEFEQKLGMSLISTNSVMNTSRAQTKDFEVLTLDEAKEPAEFADEPYVFFYEQETGELITKTYMQKDERCYLNDENLDSKGRYNNFTGQYISFYLPITFVATIQFKNIQANSYDPHVYTPGMIYSFK